ncbi:MULTISPECIES: GvpL/GvpF family gas vesicle protein [unclassified Streptomyces]|uniref:GvpL/GvpF family gas vesicle protein n=1 Tax=unclassified Streptomyces TaxID=2593676 RepID=UPI000DBA7912|nr:MULTISPECIES: GvpL/GvpF family gas vesicle protein [unclassified Streptomyces]MYT68184.1 gas vesicle protein [Streptomyces sp. SID8367]RAJ72754.1 gas vesicle protein GvpL/GvpF [Streptomyces sp. PsTaAH-137]
MPTYVYAITPDDHPLPLDDLHGVGSEGSALRVIRAAGLAAVVSTAPEELRAKRRDLAAHDVVLQRLMPDGAVLPLQFGLVGPDDDAVAAALAENQDSYRSRLAALDGRLEYNLKVARDEDDLLREILTGNAEAHRLNEDSRSSADAQGAKVRLGELVAQEIQESQRRTAAQIVGALAPTAVDSASAQAPEPHFLNVSFLVERDDAASFSQAVHEDAESRGDAYTYHLHGPLPAYSFV